MEALVATSLADEVSYRLQSGILDGTYPPGTHLLQDELCEHFGVSRTPIREALRKLQAQHLVVLVPNKGAKVRVPTRIDLQEVYAVRAELEGFAASLATPNVTDAILEELDRAQAIIEDSLPMLVEGLKPEDEAPFNAQITKGNEAFHGIVHRAAGNSRLQQLIETLQSYFPKDYVWRAQRSSDEIRALNIDAHARIRKSLEARDADGSRQAMQDHIREAGTILLAYLDERGFWEWRGPPPAARRKVADASPES